jgi:hypothetical protein
MYTYVNNYGHNSSLSKTHFKTSAFSCQTRNNSDGWQFLRIVGMVGMLRMSFITVPLDGIKYLGSAATVLENTQQTQYTIIAIYRHLTTLLEDGCSVRSVRSVHVSRTYIQREWLGRIMDLRYSHAFPQIMPAFKLAA